MVGTANDEEVAGVRRVEPLRGLDQAEAGHLGEVVVGNPAIAEPTGDGLGDVQVQADHLVAEPLALEVVVRVRRSGEQAGGGLPAVVTRGPGGLVRGALTRGVARGRDDSGRKKLRSTS